MSSKRRTRARGRKAHVWWRLGVFGQTKKLRGLQALGGKCPSCVGAVSSQCLALCGPMDCSPPGSSVCRDSPGKNAGVRCLALLQGIFPAQGTNPGLPHCRRMLYHPTHHGSPRILEWVAYPFSRGSSQHRNGTGISCIAGGFFTQWATRKPPWGYTLAYINPLFTFLPSLVAQTVKCLPTMRETRVWSLGREDLLEQAMAPHSSTLAWKIPWTEGPGRLQSMGSQRARHDWATSFSLSLYFLPVSSLNSLCDETRIYLSETSLFCQYFNTQFFFRIAVH